MIVLKGDFKDKVCEVWTGGVTKHWALTPETTVLFLCQTVSPGCLKKKKKKKRGGGHV